MLKFIPLPDTTTEAIELNGKAIGEVTGSGRCGQFHAAIQMLSSEERPDNWFGSLIQGFGTTRTAAVMDALARARVHMAQLRDRFDVLSVSINEVIEMEPEPMPVLPTGTEVPAF